MDSEGYKLEVGKEYFVMLDMGDGEMIRGKFKGYAVLGGASTAIVLDKGPTLFIPIEKIIYIEDPSMVKEVVEPEKKRIDPNYG